MKFEKITINEVKEILEEIKKLNSNLDPLKKNLETTLGSQHEIVSKLRALSIVIDSIDQALNARN